jgi:hypothetical protein
MESTGGTTFGGCFVPSKVCPICDGRTEVSQKDWSLVSQIENVVCSRGCAWEFIDGCPSAPGYLAGALQMGLGQPDAAYSQLLGMFFRSKYECYVAEALSESGIPFEYEKWTFPVKKNAYYTPDFHLPDHRVFIEVKGAWGASSKSKLTSFGKLYTHVSLLLLPWTIAHEFYPSKMEGVVGA